MVDFKAKKTPLYIQIKEYIKKHIEDSNWPIGHRLPSERELAKEMGVSRKTVSLAYKELENQGFLSSHQGRGTFVIKVPKSDKAKVYKNIVKTIDECFDTSLKIGMDADSFINLCKQRVKEYKNRLHGLKIMLVECDKEQLDYFCKELELGVEVSITPVLLQDFKANFININQKLKDFDFLITTLCHIQEVKEIINDDSINILPIALNPQLESIIKIARIPKKSSIGVLTISENFANKVERAIFKAGLRFKNTFISTATKPTEVQQFMEQVDKVIISPGRRDHVKPI